MDVISRLRIYNKAAISAPCYHAVEGANGKGGSMQWLARFAANMADAAGLSMGTVSGNRGLIFAFATLIIVVISLPLVACNKTDKAVPSPALATNSSPTPISEKGSASAATSSDVSTKGHLTTERTEHTATLLENGKVLIVGGLDQRLGALKSAEIYDPQTGLSRTTGSLNYARVSHTATALPDGKVLIVGGGSEYAEIYDPVSEKFTPAGYMVDDRFDHTSTLLSSGQVLVVGGRRERCCINNRAIRSDAEIYDPITKEFLGAGNMAVPRTGHTTTLLSNGMALIAGGNVRSDQAVGAEIFDPATKQFTLTGHLFNEREFHSATLLPDGKVLILGGWSYNNQKYKFGYLTDAEIYDPISGEFATTGNLGVARSHHTATLLADGKVLVAGGCVEGEIPSTELFDPIANKFVSTGNLDTQRVNHTATRLDDGDVLIAGGQAVLGPESVYFRSTETYRPSIDGFYTEPSNPSSSLIHARYSNSAILLNSGEVLIAGGDAGDYSTSAELFDPFTGKFTSTGRLNVKFPGPEVLLRNGKVLFLGGAYGQIESYDPDKKKFTVVGKLETECRGCTVTLLQNGKVLRVGYVESDDREGATSVRIARVELYDVDANTITSTGLLSYARNGHTATLLPNGKVLIAGGYSDHPDEIQAELYDPMTGKFSLAGRLISLRGEHTATLLQTGKVLLVGGEYDGKAIESAELYDPVINKFVPTGSPTFTRGGHSATLLSNGKVLFISAGEQTVEIYDPDTGKFSLTGRLLTARDLLPTATLLQNGNVLVAGGLCWISCSDRGAPSPEIYDAKTGAFTPTEKLKNLGGVLSNQK